MRTRKLRLVSALLALAMMFVLLPTAAFAEDTASTFPAPAEDEFDYNGLRYKKLNATDVAVVGLVNAWNGHLDIPATVKEQGKDYIVTKILKKAFYGADNIYIDRNQNRSVTIPNTVTEIGEEAFAYGTEWKQGISWDTWTGLTNVEFQEGSQLKTLAKGVFAGCYVLQAVEIPSTVECIIDGTFADDGAMKGFRFPENSNLQDIGENAFRWNAETEELVIPNKVKRIGACAFQNWEKLRVVTMPSSIESIEGNAFSGCNNLKAVYYDGTYYGKTESDWKSIVSNSTELAKATVYYARKVSFDLNGHDGTAPKAQKVYDGSKVEKPTENPKTSGYTFENWYADAECTKLFDFDEPITQNTTIYAGWTKDPVGNHVTVENGTAWVGEKQLTSEDIVEPGTTVTIKSNEKFAGDMVFDYWKDWNGNVTFANDHSAETTFVMPEGVVKVEAVAKTVEEDSDWDAGTVVTTAVLGTGMAVLAYHIGTEVYAEQVLGAGVAVPRTRGDVALKAWKLAGKPAVENAAVAPEEAAQAQQWVLENGLMENQKDGTFHPEKWMSRLAALRVLDQAQKMG